MRNSVALLKSDLFTLPTALHFAPRELRLLDVWVIYENWVKDWRCPAMSGLEECGLLETGRYKIDPSATMGMDPRRTPSVYSMLVTDHF